MITSALQFILKILKWVLHPVFVFVFIQIAIITVLILWVHWYYDNSEKLSSLALSLGRPSSVFNLEYVTLVVGCSLLAVVLAGTVIQFIILVKQKILNRQQHSFLSSVTHELRSPLASVQLLLETLQTREIDEKTKNNIFAMMKTDIERLTKLVDQILISSRLDKGLFASSQFERVDLNALINLSIQRLKYIDPEIENRIVLQSHFTNEVLTAKSILNIAIGNLLENAIKYSPQKSPIFIKLQEQDNSIVISIQDQGHGLDRNEKKRIFKMFHRGDFAIHKAIPGTGLGLYIVNETLKLLNGRVWAESTGRGNGSTFFISLPINELQI